MSGRKKLGRNDPCPCGSGIKYKRCCLADSAPAAAETAPAAAETAPATVRRAAPDAGPDPGPPWTDALLDRLAARVPDDDVVGLDPEDPVVVWLQDRRARDLAYEAAREMALTTLLDVRARAGLAGALEEVLWDPPPNARRELEHARDALLSLSPYARALHSPWLLAVFERALDELSARRAERRAARMDAVGEDDRLRLAQAAGRGDAQAAQRLATELAGDERLLELAGIALDDALQARGRRTASPSVEIALATLCPAVGGLGHAAPQRTLRWLGAVLLTMDAAATAVAAMGALPVVSGIGPLAELVAYISNDLTGRALDAVMQLLIEQGRPFPAAQLMWAMFVARAGRAEPVESVAAHMLILGDRCVVGRAVIAHRDDQLPAAALAGLQRAWSGHPWGDELQGVLEGPLAWRISDRYVDTDDPRYVVALAGLRSVDLGSAERLNFEQMRADSDEAVDLAMCEELVDGRLVLLELLAEQRRQCTSPMYVAYLHDAELLRLLDRARRLAHRGDTARAQELKAAVICAEPDLARACLRPLLYDADVPSAIAPGAAPVAGTARRLLGELLASDDDVDAAVERVPLVRRHSAGGWTVAGVRVTLSEGSDAYYRARLIRSPLQLAQQEADRLRCACGADDEPRCRHRLAVLLAIACREPGLAEQLAEPEWRAVLEPMLAAPSPSPPPASHRGWIRYLLVVADGAGRWWIDRELIRLSRRGDRPLKPQPMPARWEVACRRIDGLDDRDRALHDALERLETLEELAYTERHGRRLAGQVARTRAEILSQLAGVRDLTGPAGRPLRVEREPLVPRLAVRDAPGGHVRVCLEPALDHVLDADPPYALIGERLVPLAAGLPDLRRLTGGAIDVPADEVARFVSEGAERLGLPLLLDSLTLSTTVVHARLDPRLVLAEGLTPETLEVTLDLVYVDEATAGGAHPELARVEPGDGPSLLPVERADGRTLLLQRDPRRERQIHDGVEAAAGPLPASMSGEHAFDFVAQRLPGLTQALELTVLGDRKLLERVRIGPLRPAVQASGHGLDMEVLFGLEGVDRPRPQDVLHAWAAGRRWIRLADDSLARLPLVWLERWGATLEELEALRRPGGELPGFAAPLATQLLDAPWDDEAGATAVRGTLARWCDPARQLDAGVPRLATPETLRAELRPYQQRGYEWLAFLREAELGGILADEMGLGKTVQLLTLLLAIQPHAGPPSLVVAPTSVLHNWRLEAERFAPRLRVAVHHGADRDPAGWAGADLVVTSYALLRRDAAFGEADWDVVALDEAQAIKNPASQTAKVARAIRARQRLALTGTPMENDLLELWSLFEFLMPGFFGSREAFRRRYRGPLQSGDEQAGAALRRRLKPFILRRRKAEVATELPPLTVCVRACELDRTERAVYERVKRRYRDQVLAQVARLGVGRAAFAVLEALTRLRQACCDARLLPADLGGDADGRSAKLDLLLEMLQALREDGHRALVFSQWPSLLRLAIPRLEAAGMTYQYLDGATRDRQSLVDRWNDPDGPLAFLISLKAGGSGLNLTAADHVIHLDPWWNPAVEAQATDRAHRIGQTRPVTAYKLVAADTVEEQVLELQQRKQRLTDQALSGATRWVDDLTLEDLRQVFDATG